MDTVRSERIDSRDPGNWSNAERASWNRFTAHAVETKHKLSFRSDFAHLLEITDEELVEILAKYKSVDRQVGQNIPEYRRAKRDVQASMRRAFPAISNPFSVEDITLFIPRQTDFQSAFQRFDTGDNYQEGDENHKAVYQVSLGLILLNGEPIIQSWQDIRKELASSYEDTQTIRDAVEQALSQYMFFDLHFHLSHEYLHASSTYVVLDQQGNQSGHSGLERINSGSGEEDGDSPLRWLDEHITNYLTYKAMANSPSFLQLRGLLKNAIDNGFDFRFGAQLERLVTAEVLEHSYFHGDSDILASALNNPLVSSGAKSNEKRFDRLVKFTNQLEEETSEKEKDKLRSRIMQVIR